MSKKLQMQKSQTPAQMRARIRQLTIENERLRHELGQRGIEVQQLRTALHQKTEALKNYEDLARRLRS